MSMQVEREVELSTYRLRQLVDDRLRALGGNIDLRTITSLEVALNIVLVERPPAPNSAADKTPHP